MMTVQELLRVRVVILPSDSARRDAEILLCYCLDKPRAWLYTWPEKEVSGDCVTELREIIRRSEERARPVAYLTGEREFWSLQLAVNACHIDSSPRNRNAGFCGP